jgi:hypothetical protein
MAIASPTGRSSIPLESSSESQKLQKLSESLSISSRTLSTFSQASNLYFYFHLGDQDKICITHVCHIICFELEKVKKSVLLAVPMTWHEPTSHLEAYYFCISFCSEANATWWISCYCTTINWKKLLFLFKKKTVWQACQHLLFVLTFRRVPANT